MKLTNLNRLCAIILGTSALLPMAQAADMIHRPVSNERPEIAGPVAFPERQLTGEIEAFVQFSESSVSELNIDSMKRNGKMASSQAQKNQANKVSAQQNKMKGELKKLGAIEQSELRVGVNGVRVKVNADSLEALKALPGVRNVTPVVKHELDNAQSVPWIGTQDFWDTIGTGEGVSVAIIDTGIDYQHENFGGNGADAFPTAKVVGGWDFAGDAYNGSNTPVPDGDPLDCNGHGSHVAGSAAGIGVPGIIGPGVAKGADLYALRVFGCGGSTNLTSDAIEWAMDPNGDGDMSDHMDVINMSLGSSWGSPTDPSSIATNNAAQLGIIVATSAGNSGDVPYITGAPGAASLAISTAASTKGGETLGIELTGGINETVEAIEGSSPVRLSDGAVSGPLIQDANLIGCNATGGITADMTGGIALISRGLCGFDEKFANAMTAGAVGVVVYNDGADASRVAPIVMGGIITPIPGVMISSTDGQAVSAAISGGASVNALLDENITTDTAYYDLIAGFSSRGPGHGGSTFKPDVTNPGVDIFSTAAGTVNGGVSLQGTSMASPHTAGVAALMHQQHPNLDSAAIKAIIQNSTVDMQQALPLARQGVGRVSVSNAMTLSSYASPGGVSFGRLNPEGTTVLKKEVAVTDISGSKRSFTATHVPNQTLPGVSVSCDSNVNVSANGTSKYKIKISLDPSQMPYDTWSYTQTEVDGWCILDDGEDSLRIGYMATVDPASRMSVRNIGHGIQVENLSGQAAGFAEGFTLAGLDGLLLDGTNNAIAAVGFRSVDPANYGGFPVIEIAVASEQIWESPSNLEWDMNIDVNHDGVYDATLVVADYSALSPTGTEGQMVSAQFAGGGFLDWLVNAIDYNDRVAIFPFTMDPFGYVNSSFDYELLVFGRDGSVDVQYGSIDLANEVIPESASFGFFGGGSANFSTSGASGDMLWIFPNNAPGKQAQTVTVK